MIKSFNCKKTKRFFETRKPNSFKELGIVSRVALRKLAIVNYANVIADLRIPPGNRLEALSGDRKGQFSIRINDQYRVCFKFDEGHAFDVEIVDYHR